MHSFQITAFHHKRVYRRQRPPCAWYIGKWNYSSTHTSIRQYMELNGQIHAPAAALWEQKNQPHSTGGQVGPRASIDTAQSRTPDHPSRAQSLNRLPSSLTEEGSLFIHSNYLNQITSQQSTTRTNVDVTVNASKSINTTILQNE